MTNDGSVTAGLTNPPSTYPLPSATHTNVLQVVGQVVNPVQSVSGGIVILDQMQWPVWSEATPYGDPDAQFAFCVWTNGQLMIWHHNTVASPATNEWRVLSNSPWIGTNAWARFTIVQDYSNSMFQIRVNQAAPIEDSTG